MMGKQQKSSLPIKLADVPVGPKIKTVGLEILEPLLVKTFEQCCEITSISLLFPTPPPPANYKC